MRIGGILTAMATPFDEEGRLDEEAAPAPPPAPPSGGANSSPDPFKPL